MVHEADLEDIKNYFLKARPKGGNGDRASGGNLENKFYNLYCKR